MVTRWEDKASGGIAAHRLDPHVRWALRTEWRGYARFAGWRDDGDRPIWIIAEAQDRDALLGAAKDGRLRVPKEYLTALSEGGPLPLFFTARVDRSELGWLIEQPHGLRWKLAVPMREPDSVADPSTDGTFGPARDLAAMKSPNPLAAAVEAIQPLQPPGPVAGAIAVIDYGCPFLNTAFQTPFTTRVAALWDQGDDGPVPAGEREGRGWPWTGCETFGYGREMGATTMQALVMAARERDIDERSIYAGIDHLVEYRDPRRRVWYATHGGHVLDVAAGAIDPLTGGESDPAAQANIIFVQLPLPTAVDSGGSALAPHVLDGVRYAMRRVQAGTPLVVNVSYGGQAGPHDGSSLIERALDDLVEKRPRDFAIVLAVGNARNTQCHARRSVRRDRSALLRCHVPETDTTDTFVEFWYTAPPADAALRLRVRGPDGVWSPWVAAGQEVALCNDGVGREVIALLRHDLEVPDGERAQALLALAPTAQPGGVPGPLAMAGIWEIEVGLVQPQQRDLTVDVDAWVERDDPGLGSGGSRPCFVDQEVNDDFDTVSSLASGRRTVRVGGFNLGTGLEAPYSSRGTPERPLPWVWAACEADETQPTIAAAATRSGERFPLNGTSVAAPVLARRLYNHMVLHGPVGHARQKSVVQQMTKDRDERCLKLFPDPSRR